jgi:hypothetical protein
MEPEKLSKCRAEVIERFINIEFLLNAIISQAYFGKVSRQFLLEVLYDEYFSFALKRKVIEKLLVRHKMLDKVEIEDLNRLNTIRNYFAHLNIEFIEGANTIVPNPRNPLEAVDFEKLHKEFLQKEKPAREYLFGVLKELGGKVERN